MESLIPRMTETSSKSSGLTLTCTRTFHPLKKRTTRSWPTCTGRLPSQMWMLRSLTTPLGVREWRQQQQQQMPQLMEQAPMPELQLRERAVKTRKTGKSMFTSEMGVYLHIHRPTSYTYTWDGKEKKLRHDILS